MSDGHITSEILRLMSVLSPLSRSRVVILEQLVSFPRTRSRHQTSVRLINDDLRQRIGAPNIYWCHEYEFANSSPFFCQMAFSATSMRRYWRSVRTVVGRVLRHNPPQYVPFSCPPPSSLKHLCLNSMLLLYCTTTPWLLRC